MERTKKKGITYIFIILFTIVIVVLSGLLTKNNDIDTQDKQLGNYICAKAKVMKIIYDDTGIQDKGKDENYLRKQEMNIKILSGNHKGQFYKIRNTIETIDIYKIIVSEGDDVLVNMTEDENGEVTTIHVYDIVRDKYTYILVLIFMLSLGFIGGIKGVKSVITLIFTGIMVIKVLLPLINNGYNPIITAVLVCISIVIVTLLIISGINKKTLTAALGTLGGVLIAGILALIIGHAAKVTGLAGDHAQVLALIHKSANLDFKGILFAAIIIGSLGAVMDVTMSVASSMSEIIDIKPEISKKELIKSGMNIGKDIMGTMSNTLILAYTGGAIQLLLLLMSTKITYMQMINLDMITSEIITALSGSIGLVWSIPLTVVIGAVIEKNK